ncbi:MAG: 30S ribosomal protein S7 [Firmicutes bacterium]|nr:30S ribosomal protein S7 [Bacillota bacterium]
MPRRGMVERRDVPLDPVYSNKLVTQLTNKVMLQGKKSLSEATVRKALEIAGSKSGKSPVEVLETALKNVMPVLEVRPRRVGGATYQVPIEVRAERRVSLGMRWLLQSAKDRKDRTMAERLAGELVDASNNQGGAVKKREDTHRMAEANKAFAHYRW